MKMIRIATFADAGKPPYNSCEVKVLWEGENVFVHHRIFKDGTSDKSTWVVSHKKTGMGAALSYNSLGHAIEIAKKLDHHVLIIMSNECDFGEQPVFERTKEHRAEYRSIIFK